MPNRNLTLVILLFGVCLHSIGALASCTPESTMQCLHPIAMYRVGSNKATGKDVLRASPNKFAFDGSPSLFVPCGKCVACRENRRKEWCSRMQSELWTNPAASFVTLTYDDSHYPSDGLCDKRHIQRFIKRFRNVGRDYNINLGDFKYFIVSEYGAKFGRPHYHGILFGVDMMTPSWHPEYVLSKCRYPVYSSSVLSRLWGNGFVTVDRVTLSTIAYVSKYITKQDNRVFALYSRGIGRDFYASDSGLTKSAYNAYDNGFVVLRQGDFFTKSRVPRFVDRLADKFDPEFFAKVKHRRHDFVVSSVCDLRSADERSVALIQRLQNEKLNRILDNES